MKNIVPNDYINLLPIFSAAEMLVPSAFRLDRMISGLVLKRENTLRIRLGKEIKRKDPRKPKTIKCSGLKAKLFGGPNFGELLHLIIEDVMI